MKPIGNEAYWVPISHEILILISLLLTWVMSEICEMAADI